MDKKYQQHLSDEQKKILVEKGTETPFSGALLHNKDSGIYSCAACGSELFSSDHKFDSQSGWPSFYDLKKKENIKLVEDNSLGMRRIEVVCAICGGHLGHVFNDAPQTPTGMRFCINSASLDFKPDKK